MSFHLCLGTYACAYHHRYWAEAHSKVVGELRAAGVARVHGDNRVMVLEHYLYTHEVDVRFAHHPALCKHLHLLGHNRQHFDVDAVELVQAGPSTRLWRLKIHKSASMRYACVSVCICVCVCVCVCVGALALARGCVSACVDAGATCCKLTTVR